LAALIDTNVAIYVRDGQEEVAARVAELPAAPLISIVTRVELEGGVVREKEDRALRRARLDTFLSIVDELPFASREAVAYSKIIEARGYSRRQIFDRMIAATAIVHQLRLITFNGEDFHSIEGLDLEVWPSPV